MLRLLGLAGLTGLVALCDCSSSANPGDASGPDATGPDATGTDAAPTDASQRVPRLHRTSDATCATARPAGACSLGGGSSSCHTDSDCTAGTNGRCLTGFGGAPLCACTYDACTGDSACATGQACACHDDPLVNGGNACVPGNCRVDSDCGAAGYCSPSPAEMGCGGLGGYYCHTPGDRCVDDTDCNGDAGAPQTCAFITEHAIWQCTPVLLCG